MVKSEAPSPDKYSIPSKDFSQTSRGFQFGMSRDKFAKVYIKEHPGRDTSVPGPGAYDIHTQITEQHRGAYSLRPKTNFQSSTRQYLVTYTLQYFKILLRIIQDQVRMRLFKALILCLANLWCLATGPLVGPSSPNKASALTTPTSAALSTSPAPASTISLIV